MATVVAMRFSVLDRGAAGPLDQVAEHARHVERLGFRRFLVAEQTNLLEALYLSLIHI